ncbi:MAG: ABC transporter ATP-binding protein [Chlorobi bacterium]|nr:ABC transporter ATP-binding protein [Chlorobiota bacterium]
MVGIGPIIVLGYGMTEVINGNLTLGKLIAFNSFLGYLFGPSSRLVSMNVRVQKSLVALARIFELYSNGVAYKNVFGKKKKQLIGRIEFQNVTFSYPDTNKIVLKNINLIIEEHTTVGIVGESGSGKTTLTKLLTGLYMNYKGKILFDEIELKEYDAFAIRDYLAFVEQEPLLFSDTILNNIRIGRLNATEDEIVRAAKKAHIHDFISSLPEQYLTELNERGLNFSTGQKQRIAIARAILRKPSILILDEPTSSLDSNIESLIFHSLKDFINSRTTIIIAHRLSTVEMADKIFVLKEGSIVGQGSHKELMQSCDYYKMLWEKQHQGFLCKN